MFRWALAYAEAAAEWTLDDASYLLRHKSKAERLVLAGYSTHGLLSYSSQGAVQAKEDLAEPVEYLDPVN